MKAKLKNTRFCTDLDLLLGADNKPMTSGSRWTFGIRSTRDDVRL